MNETRRLAGRTAGVDLAALPAEVVKAAKQHVLDGLGNQIAASAISEPTRVVAGLIARWGGEPLSTVVGYGYRLAPPNAALLNAMMGHGVELDDAHGPALVKAGSSLVPTVMATAEAADRTGADVLVGMVAGYEAAIRMGLAMVPSHRKRGYHGSGTAGTFGTAAASARVLGLDEEKTTSALGIAAMQAAGIQAYLKSPAMVKPFSPGKAAFNGTLSGFLAAEGFTGPATALQNEEGFLKAYTDEVNWVPLSEENMDHWKIMEVGYKPHAACRYAHGPIDAAQMLHREHNVDIADVESIDVTLCELAVRQSGHTECPNLNATMGSTPFGVAMALTMGSNGLLEYRAAFADQRIHDLARTVNLIIDQDDPGMGLMGRAAAVSLLMKDGTRLTQRVEGPKGEPEDPLTDDELVDKFTGLASMVLPEENVDKIVELVHNLENLDSVAELMSLMIVPGGQPVILEKALASAGH